MKAAALTLMLGLAPATGAASMELEFPALATSLAVLETAGDSVFLPVGPFADGKVRGVNAEGAVLQQAWRVGSGVLTTLQLLAPLRAQLEFAGYEILFECEAVICGGFDFRFELQTFPEPEMHVSLGDFRYLAAKKIRDGLPEYASLIVSRSGNAGFVQLTQVGASATAARASSLAASPGPVRTPNAGPVGTQLETLGHATLDDLVFRTGRSELGDDTFPSLTALAAYLATRPDRRVVLVGHTDSEGALDGNLALSKRRATAVMERLIRAHGVNPRQVSADGVGFLSPVASNLTAKGRAQNRRVEVVLSSTE